MQELNRAIEGVAEFNQFMKRAEGTFEQQTVVPERQFTGNRKQRRAAAKDARRKEKTK